MRESPDIPRSDDYSSFQHPLKNSNGIDAYVDEDEVCIRGDILQAQARKLAIEKVFFPVDEAYRLLDMIMISLGSQSHDLGKGIDIKGFLDLTNP